MCSMFIQQLSAFPMLPMLRRHVRECRLINVRHKCPLHHKTRPGAWMGSSKSLQTLTCS